MSSSNANDNSQASSSAGSSGRRQRLPQNRPPNQQQHSNRIYTHHRPQYRKNPGSVQKVGGGGGAHAHGGSNEQLAGRTRQRLASSMSIGDPAKMCICCWHELHTYVYYSCAHFVCLNCSIKMRVLCEKIDCPVCRQESRRVLCTKTPLEANDAQSIERRMDEIGDAGRLQNPPNLVPAGVYFDNEQIRAELLELLAYRCGVCSQQLDSQDELERHLRKSHQRFFCELCIENLKLFPFERKSYDREGLAQHKRNGDRDDFSFKGHPLCDYCDQRFFDKDVLYRHFRKEHYYCHFCDTDGHEEYYRDYAQLRMHFLKCHYLCELDGCSANAAQTHEYVVFRSDVDFQAHKKQKHAKSKSDARALGKLNLEFNYTDSARDRQQRRRGGGGGAAATSADFMLDQRPSQTRDVDVNVLRASREQFEADEAERSRQKRLEAMREQHRKYEETLQEQYGASNVVEEVKPPPDVTPKPTPVPVAATAATNEPSLQWRNVIGGGTVPRMDTTSEFPTLASEASSKFMSLAELGASIGSWAPKASKTSPWAASSASKAPPGSSKKPHSPPRLEETANLEQPKPQPPKKSEKKPKSTPTKPKTDSQAQVEETKPVVAAPPPGFESIKTLPQANAASLIAGPPPGFNSAAAAAAAAAVVVPAQTPKTPVISVEFIKPVDYEARNLELKSKLVALFDKKAFNEFMTLSIDFKNGEITSRNYLEKCMGLLDFTMPGNSQIGKFLELVQEMIVLLPSAIKQEQLFEAYEDALGNTTWAAKVVNKLRQCSVCEQYFTQDELNPHRAMHHPKEELPKTEDEGSVSNQPSWAPLSMSKSSSQAAVKTGAKKIQAEEEFPPLGNGILPPNSENRYSSMPTASLFSNPSSHLSLANKKKHRLQK